MKSAMTASRLRLVLVIVMLLIVVAATTGFVFAQQYLANYATSISKLNADAQSGDKNLETLSNLKNVLTEDAMLIARTRSIVADKSTYTDQFLNDISRIASQTGVNVTGIEYSDDEAVAAPGTPTTPAQPAAPSKSTNGVTKKTILVSIQSPLNYSKLMNFLQGIETNSLKMQVASVSMNKDKGNDVTTQDLSIEVYVR